MTIEQVAPAEFAETASQVLQESWAVPCLHYSPDYLRWQLGFPGSHPPLAFAAFDGNEAVGFAGATPRRLRLGDVVSDVYLASFLAVRPSSRLTHVASSLYMAIVLAFRDANIPVIGFAVPGAAGERSAERAYPAGQFQFRKLGPFPGYAFTPRPNPPPSPVRVRETTDVAELIAAIRPYGDARTLCNEPNGPLLEHYRRDPQPRSMVLLQRRRDVAIGGAMIVRYEFATAHGISSMTMIDNLFLPQPDPETLRALCQFASERWADSTASATVLMPNVWGIEPAVLRSAGLRQTSSGFNGYLAVRDPSHPFLSATGTNLEIV